MPLRGRAAIVTGGGAGLGRGIARALAAAGARVAVLDLDEAAARETAEAIRESGGAADLVTLAGELLSRHGVYTGGYMNGDGSGTAPSSILGRFAILRTAPPPR